jgi:hypothetical protein
MWYYSPTDCELIRRDFCARMGMGTCLAEPRGFVGGREMGPVGKQLISSGVDMALTELLNSQMLGHSSSLLHVVRLS